MDFYSGLRKLHQGLMSGEMTSSDLVHFSLEQIEAVDSQVQAFVTVTDELAKSQAAKLDVRRSEGLLAGIPFALKDNMCTQGVETTCASRILKGYIPPYSATAARKLEAAEGILVGKLNMDEFAMGSSTENSALMKTHNPWDYDCVPGGSSGGSAAAVAAGMVPYALGSDTGGSIRQPAAFCGVVGLKPSYGRVSRFGLVAFASSLDQIGPITHTVEDAAIVLQEIAGKDRRDSTSVEREVPDYIAGLTGDIRGLRIGVAKEYFSPAIEEGVRTAVEAAILQMQRLGATIVEVSLPHTAYALSAYYLIAPAEASSNLARYDGVRYGYRAEGVENLLDMYRKTRSIGFGAEVKRRILVGTYALSSGYYDAYYKRAQQVRTLIAMDFDAAFHDVDVIVSPTTPTTAFRFGEKTKDPLTMYMNDICTIPVNLAGLPAISVPCGLSDGLPVGMQLIGRMYDEATLLKTAHAYEQAAGFAPMRPALGVHA
ncbi:Glutamyl-tRNA(Gln) amidotransferase subunit A [Acidibacillus sp. S0AB]|uniref:Glutamyl-tRNA(Gln) amidotransferase subunit A n=2 Tax=Sulfoacidibacillus ferrooxidans TaxID=2005001 RepID=A0A9X1V788_9BACL|nr:Glutamyl-tRNA(Gln) amidotransferase subunit A [Sulfoacidibacillus ferrooxidans]